MKWHVAVPAILGGACGLVALTLGVVHDDLTPRTVLLIIYLVSAFAVGVLTGLIVWAAECVRDEIRASSAIYRATLRDDDSSPRLRGLRN